MLLAAGQLLVWWLVHPSAWRDFVGQHAPGLSPEFSLIQLPRDLLRLSELRRVLIISLVVLPTLSGLISLIFLFFTRQFDAHAFWGMVQGVLIGLSLSAVVGVAAGTTATCASIFILSLFWSRADVMLLDFLLSQPFGILFGLVALLTLIVSGNLARRRLAFAPPREMGGVVIGTIVGLAVTVGIALVVTALFSQRDVGVNINTTDQTTWVVPLITALVYMAAAQLRGRRLNQTVLVGSIAFCVMTFAITDGAREYGRDPLAWQLLFVISLTLMIIFVMLFMLTFAFVERIAGAWAGSVAGSLTAVGFHIAMKSVLPIYTWQNNMILTVLLVLLGVTSSLWLPILAYPFEVALATLLLREDQHHPATRVSVISLHPVFWHEGQRYRLLGLDEHLVMLYGRDAEMGQAALTFVAQSLQRWAAQVAQITLDARQLAVCESVEAIASQLHAQQLASLASPVSDLLATFRQISLDARAALAQSSQYNQLLILRSVDKDLSMLISTLIRSNDTHAQRFIPSAKQWQRIMADRIKVLEKDALVNQEIPDPYVVGVPLKRHRELFVGRTEITMRIEGLLRNQDQPPLLLYGQRRMGKTSLLFNLRYMLPSSIVPIIVDLQGPVSQSDNYPAFFYNVARQIIASAHEQELDLNSLSLETLQNDPFTRFDEWLDHVEQVLIDNNHNTLLLALDEFESLNQALSTGRLREDAVLGTLRHIIQYRPRFKLILAGSHTLAEFMRWSSYLINAQTIHLSYLKEAESVQLIERPVKDFPLRYTADARECACVDAGSSLFGAITLLRGCDPKE